MNEPDDWFESSARFDDRRVQAAALYCSDGRWGEQIDDLLHNSLKLPRYDRLAVPGGAACLAGHFATYREEEGVAAQLRFLVEVHRLEQLVLIAHEGCAFYTDRLHVSPLQLEQRQRDDMQKAIRHVRGFGRHLQVRGFLGWRDGDRIRFEPIELRA
jgi:hypothetical protein